MVEVLSWKCICGKEISSLYKAQLSSNKEDHLRSHRARELRKKKKLSLSLSLLREKAKRSTLLE